MQIREKQHCDYCEKQTKTKRVSFITITLRNAITKERVIFSPVFDVISPEFELLTQNTNICTYFSSRSSYFHPSLSSQLRIYLTDSTRPREFHVIRYQISRATGASSPKALSLESFERANIFRMSWIFKLECLTEPLYMTAIQLVPDEGFNEIVLYIASISEQEM